MLDFDATTANGIAASAIGLVEEHDAGTGLHDLWESLAGDYPHARWNGR